MDSQFVFVGVVLGGLFLLPTLVAWFYAGTHHWDVPADV
jgi:hypothetical protein